MLPALQTSLVSFAVFGCLFPGKLQSTYVEAPTSRRFDSLEAISEWVKKFDLPIITRAFISIELRNDQLSMPSQKFIEQYQGGIPERLVLYVKKPLMALADKLVNQSIPQEGNNEEERLEFQILEIDGSKATGGIYAEVAHGHDIASDTAWWEGQLPGSVIGHISIRAYRGMVLPDVLSAMEDKEVHGTPETLEELLGNDLLQVIHQFTKIQ